MHSDRNNQPPIAEAFAGMTVADLIRGGEPDVPDQFAARLLRTGYLKIDCSGLFTGDVYAPADEITAVYQNTVRLGRGRASLMRES
ncbi:hypothetical protein Aab01nite_53750 [Paractinoplanes abujensis]|uniref:Uncharacterized protein n=1 Tax=Paractinoplanes abujensis TaxID=882441 RepID=A0A7W7CRT8_9ACTN|nr:hypothetical protein [Actinoplanes abujensis]MBB4693555.1 hypothetical protein [Actinoplanes abujensis]GID21785.1 hypothetical protein Aab01nite_53750 [Actinoplanes abujensis]